MIDSPTTSREAFSIHADAGPFLARLALEPLLASPDLVSAWMALLGSNLASGGAGSNANDPTLEPLGQGVALLKVHGPMMRRPAAWEKRVLGAVDTEELRSAAEGALHPSVLGLVLDIDSPGGFLTGGPEFADMLSAVADAKPLVAWSGGQMASLAYWAGSQAHVTMASPSASVGSIGVYCVARDFSRLLESFGIRTEVFTNREGVLKGIGILGRSLTDAHRGHLQGIVDGAFADFKAAIGRRRSGINPAAMMGQTLSGPAAVSHGLLNQVGSFADAVAILKKSV